MIYNSLIDEKNDRCSIVTHNTLYEYSRSTVRSIVSQSAVRRADVGRFSSAIQTGLSECQRASTKFHIMGRSERGS